MERERIELTEERLTHPRGIGNPMRVLMAGSVIVFALMLGAKHQPWVNVKPVFEKVVTTITGLLPSRK